MKKILFILLLGTLGVSCSKTSSDPAPQSTTYATVTNVRTASFDIKFISPNTSKDTVYATIPSASNGVASSTVVSLEKLKIVNNTRIYFSDNFRSTWSIFERADPISATQSQYIINYK
jgi:hypothetical protein